MIIITIIYQRRNIGSEETNNNKNNNEAELSFPRSDSHPRSLWICKVGHMLRFCQLFHFLALIRPNLIFTCQTKTLTHPSLLACEEENLPYEELLARQGEAWRQKDGRSKEGLVVCTFCLRLTIERRVARARRRVRLNTKLPYCTSGNWDFPISFYIHPRPLRFPLSQDSSLSF